MKKMIPLLLALLMLCGCGAEAEETTAPPTAMVTEPVATATEEPPTTVPPTTVPPTTVMTEPVIDESWFDDALFIGESRTAGLQGYGRLGKADYFCGECLTVYGVLGITASDANFPEQSLPGLLSWKQYGKIYIHLGINELGGDLEKFAAQYQKVIDEIRKLQPEAHIILQSVLALGEGYSTRPAFSRESIQAMNDCIQALAEENGLLFSDVNQVMTNEEGYLIADLTFDGCHLYATGCEKWAQWLLEEAATFQIP
jgi:lysophospholipase L1-like esterase